MYDLNTISNLHLEPSTRCNAACPLCARNYSGGRTRPDLRQGELRLADIQSIFSGSLIQKVRYITMCGNAGDPCSARDLVEICKWLLSVAAPDARIAINTNGGLRDRKFWTALAQVFPRGANRGHVVFSIDGLADTNHIYRRKVIWEKVWENLNTFVSHGGESKWDFLTFRHNAHQIEEVTQICLERGIDLRVKRPLGFDAPDGRLECRPVYGDDGAYEYSLYPEGLAGPDREPERVGTIFHPGSGEIPDDLPLNLHENELSKSVGISCKSFKLGGDEFYISAQGEVLPCCYVGSGMVVPFDFSRVQLYKNVRAAGAHWNSALHHPLEEILTSTTMREIFYDSWSKSSARAGRMQYCVNHCGTGNKLDLIYKGKFLGGEKFKIFPENSGAPETVL